MVDGLTPPDGALQPASPDALTFAESLGNDLFGRTQAAALAALAERHDEIMTALAVASDADPATAIRVSAAVWRYWLIRGHLPAGRTRLERALAAHRGSAEVHGRGMVALGIVTFFMGDYDEAARAARAYLGENHRELSQEAFARTVLGWVSQARGDHEAAVHCFEKALKTFRALGHGWGEAVSQLNLGEVARSEGRYEMARHYYRAALEIYRELEEPSAVAATLCNLGYVAVASGTDGREAFREALHICRALGNRQFVPGILLGFAADAARRGSYDEAALLVGAADGALAAIRGAYEPADQLERDRAVALLRERMPSRVQQRMDEGRAEPLDHILQFL